MQQGNEIKRGIYNSFDFMRKRRKKEVMGY